MNAPQSTSEALPDRQRRRAPAALRILRGAICMLGLALVLLATSGCGRAQHAAPTTQDSFTVTFATEPASPAVGDGILIITLRDAASGPVTGATLSFEANMSHAGMTPVAGQASTGQDGVYRAPLAWTMAGDWFVDVKFTLSDGQTVARRFPVSVRAK